MVIRINPLQVTHCTSIARPIENCYNLIYLLHAYILCTKNLAIVMYAGLPRSGKKFWKMKNFPGQGKVRELHFQSGKFKKSEKSHRKVREFQSFPKKMLVNRLLEILVSIICKQY